MSEIATQFAGEANEVMAAEEVDMIRAESIRIDHEGVNAIGEWGYRMGGAYKRARDTFPTITGAGDQPLRGRSRPGWNEFVEENYKVSPNTVAKFIRAYEFALTQPALKGQGVELLSILAAQDAPEAAKTEIINKIEEGQKVSTRRAKKIIEKHRPSPSDAREIARETGKLTLASDGNIYSGATDEEAQDHENRRDQTYRIIDAINDLANCPLNATEWMDQTEKHWLREFEPAMIDRAMNFLGSLSFKLKEGKGIIDA